MKSSKKKNELSAAAQEQLTGFRREIDTIDDQLIALMKQRIGIVQSVGDLKRKELPKQNFIRSGREAEMVRRIHTAFSDSPFHAQAAVVIWRQIIGASTHCEMPLSLIVLNSQPQHESLIWQAREYFGSFIPCKRHGSVSGLMSDLRQNPGAIGIVPAVSEQMTETWWLSLLSDSPERPYIFAALPFIRNGSSLEQPAYALAILKPEETGDDVSVLVAEATSEGSVHVLREWLKQKEVRCDQLVKIEHEQQRYYLMELHGYLPPDSDFIKSLKADFSWIQHISWLGAYAQQITQS